MMLVVHSSIVMQLLTLADSSNAEAEVWGNNKPSLPQDDRTILRLSFGRMWTGHAGPDIFRPHGLNSMTVHGRSTQGSPNLPAVDGEVKRTSRFAKRFRFYFSFFLLFGSIGSSAVFGWALPLSSFFLFLLRSLPLFPLAEPAQTKTATLFVVKAIS